MSAEKFRQVTDATQAEFLAHQQEVLSQHVAQGDHPNAVMLRRLLGLWQKNGSPEKLAHLNRVAMSYSPLADIVGQYIDPAGEPKAAVLENGKVKLGDQMACFGRSCGFQDVCWTQCSLGPSKHANGALPQGAQEGAAVPTHPKGYLLGDQPVSGVLCQVNDPTTGQPRHRSNACNLLATFSHVFAIPPAPTGAISDALFDQIGPTIAHVESRLEAEKVAPAAANVPSAAPPVASPPVAGVPASTPPAAPPASAPPTAPPSGAPPVAPTAPPAGMSPTAPPTSAPPTAPPASAPPTAAPAAPPVTQPAAAPVNPGAIKPFFDDTTIEQEWELRALKHALINSPEKSKSEEAVDNMIERNNKTYKKCRGALFKACADRGLTTDTSLKTGRLKAEFWGDIEIPQGYFEVGVPQETTEAPPAVETPAPASAPPTAPPVSAPPAAGPVVSITPQAKAPQQRIDEDKDNEPQTPEGVTSEAVPSTPETVDEADAQMARLEEGAEASRKLRESLVKDKPGANYQVQDGQVTKQTISFSAFDKVADAFNNLADAYRERTALMRAQAMGVLSKTHDSPEPDDGNFELHPVKEDKKPAKKPQAKTAKTPTKKSAKKSASSKSGKPSSKGKAEGDAKPHPKHPTVQKDPCPWQPGTRGRPPKGVTRNKKTGEYKFPKTWQQINGKWHPPLK